MWITVLWRVETRIEVSLFIYFLSKELLHTIGIYKVWGYTIFTELFGDVNAILNTDTIRDKRKH